MRLKARRLILILAVSIVTATLARALYGHLYDVSLEHHFGQIAHGMNEARVTSIMGRPDSIGKCGELGGMPDNCYREYLYEPKLPTFSTWAVFFDSEGRSVGKYEYQSP